ncbi:ABC transporter ATP-binding protein [Caldicellulosiruptor morganii]|uniref:ABC transporter ATP-binding protein n=1 Tax=Caldicellulosiruptor morganii TaxID=1387555 RepID=A0ABY7BKE4_9FIRM|nr:ABC transporter ATP-binding protein [Caldicellulosiruptor morganii]WAM32797.1 ABC transporter ATP-binding protein [Caldicellulosiruptor morganii]
MNKNQEEKAIELIEVDKKIRNFQILNNINISIKKGEIVGLVGPNGAGKSTLMKILAGLWAPKPKGECYILGCDVTKEKERIEVLRRASFFIETPALYSKLSGYDNIELYSKLKYGSTFNVKDEINRLAPFFELENNMLKRKAKAYSLGTKQKVGLLQMFIGNPEVLILDEPFNGLDPTVTIKVKELLKTRWRENNITVLISSHILSDIEELCSRIIFIKNGSIILDKNKEELLKSNTVVIFHFTEKEHVDLACRLIKEKLPHVSVETQFNNSIKIHNISSYEDIFNLLQNEGIKVRDIEEQRMSLVDFYKQLYLQ